MNDHGKIKFSNSNTTALVVAQKFCASDGQRGTLHYRRDWLAFDMDWNFLGRNRSIKSYDFWVVIDNSPNPWLNATLICVMLEKDEAGIWRPLKVSSQGQGYAVSSIDGVYVFTRVSD